MKIVIIANAFPLISETFILSEIIYLLEEGHDVRIISLYSPQQNKYHIDFAKYKLEERVTYINKPHKFIPTIINILQLIFSSNHKIGREIISSLNIYRYGKFAKNLDLLFFYLKLRSNNIDIVHCHFGTTAIYGKFLKDIRFTNKCFVTFHGFDINRCTTLHEQENYRYIIDNNINYIVNSKYLKEKLLKLNFPPSKINIIPASIDGSKYTYRKRTLKKNEPITIITIARLVMKKGYPFSIEAVAKLIKEKYSIHYEIVGDGEERNTLIKLVDEFKIKKYVTFHGSLSQSEIIPLLKNSHIFLLPSIIDQLGDTETQGVVLYEAILSGLPIVSTNVGGIPETLENIESAILIQQKKPDQLYKAILKIIKNYSLFISKTKDSREKSLLKYDANIIYKDLVELFNKN